MRFFFSRIIVSLIVILVLSMCGRKQGDPKAVKAVDRVVLRAKEPVKVNKKKIYYDSLMRVKSFVLIRVGKCEDAYDDSIHDKKRVYFESKKYEQDSVTVNFKFIDDCCQEFLGDYKVINHQLIFELEKVNDVICPCECWYRYSLHIRKKNFQFSGVNIYLRKNEQRNE